MEKCGMSWIDSETMETTYCENDAIEGDNVCSECRVKIDDESQVLDMASYVISVKDALEMCESGYMGMAQWDGIFWLLDNGEIELIENDESVTLISGEVFRYRLNFGDGKMFDCSVWMKPDGSQFVTTKIVRD